MRACTGVSSTYIGFFIHFWAKKTDFSRNIRFILGLGETMKSCDYCFNQDLIRGGIMYSSDLIFLNLKMPTIPLAKGRFVFSLNHFFRHFKEKIFLIRVKLKDIFLIEKSELFGTFYGACETIFLLYNMHSEKCTIKITNFISKPGFLLYSLFNKI